MIFSLHSHHVLVSSKKGWIIWCLKASIFCPLLPTVSGEMGEKVVIWSDSYWSEAMHSVTSNWSRQWVVCGTLWHCDTLCAPFLAESPHPTPPTFPIALCVHSPGLPEIVTFCCNSDCHVARSSGQPIKCRSSFAKRTRFQPFLIKIPRSQISTRFCPWKSFVCSTVPLLCTQQQTHISFV